MEAFSLVPWQLVATIIQTPRCLIQAAMWIVRHHPSPTTMF